MIVPIDLIYLLALVFYLEGILSIDNAAVLGAMVSTLPTDEPVPWPRILKFLSVPTRRLIGPQRDAALKVGLLGAYIGRGVMLFFANLVIQSPWLKVLGGLYLIKLAFEYLAEAEPGDEEQVELGRITRKSFWGVVLSVELADLAFSLDNVVAVVAVAPNNFWLVMFGVAMGILTMRFAASIFTRWIEREPILKSAAYILVLNIGVELLLQEIFGVHISDLATFVLSFGTLALAIFYSHFTPLHFLHPGFRWLGEGMANANAIYDQAITRFMGLIRQAFRISMTIAQKTLVMIRRPIAAASTEISSVERAKE